MKKEILNTAIFFISLIFSLETAALELKLVEDNLNNSDLPEVRNLVNTAEHMLPPELKRRLDKTLLVTFAPIQQHGKTSSLSNEVILSETLLPHIARGRKNAIPNTTLASHHKTYYDVALGTLLHEISHQYDLSRLGNISDESLKRDYILRSECREITAGDNGQNSIPARCTLFNFKNNISDNPQFLYSVSWHPKKISGHKVTEEDDQTLRSPNPYEFKNPEEAFAVNFEFYLMDPEYKCRRPTAYQLLSKHFGYYPYKNHHCNVGSGVMTTMILPSETKIVFDELNADRVYEVHYLLADKGDSSASRWGHSMLRLVICAPFRTQVGPDCLKDITYHKVISYAAAVNDLAIDKLKGLTGGYSSRIYIMPLLNVINEYTQLELRDLISYPLFLNHYQIADLITRVKEQFWSYRGQYFFISNNCAVETFNLLKMLFPKNSEFASERINTPNGLKEIIFKNHVGRDLKTQENSDGLYIWKSKKETFEKLLISLNRSTGSNYKTMNDWLNQPPSKDIEIFEKLKKIKKDISTFFILEKLKLEKLSHMRNIVILDFESKQKDSEIIQRLKESRKSEIGFIGNHYKGTYGIPFDSEMTLIKNLIQNNENDSSNAQNRKLIEDTIEEKTRTILGSEFLAELQMSEKMLLDSVEYLKPKKSPSSTQNP
ncbi:DUF4105 domain-containing protein [Bdellovibrio bacteriovorus]|uniref:DUF7844 domain-containing protein n=1 Tax=Bdellovibrio TaxID=958 RepID=UPI0035A86FDF